MSHSAEAGREALPLLISLCREIAAARAGIGIGIRDSVPRLVLTAPTGLEVDVRVDDDGGQFVWRPWFGRHSSADVPGAAAALIRLVREGDGASGGELR